LNPDPPLSVEVDADVTGGTMPVAVPGLPWRNGELPVRAGFDGAAPAIGVGDGVGLIAVGAVEVGPVAITGTSIVGVVEPVPGCVVVEVGSVEVGSVDVGSVEVGSVDVGSVDVGSVDVGSVDVGSVDVGSVDVGLVDIGSVDVGLVDVVGPVVAPVVCTGKPASSGSARALVLGACSEARDEEAAVLGAAPVWGSAAAGVDEVASLTEATGVAVAGAPGDGLPSAGRAAWWWTTRAAGRAERWWCEAPETSCWIPIAPPAATTVAARIVTT
jgi:hypothetical protein